MKKFTLYFTLATALIVNTITALAQPTVLNPGDIAFTGYNGDDNTINAGTTNKDICFILLRNINAGTTIFFTDFGWRSDAAAFQTANPCGGSTGAVTDGIIQWTASINMEYGMQVNIRCRTAPLSANTGTVTGTQATFNTPTDYLTLALGGDQVFAYQGSFASPTLLAGLNMNGAWDATLLNCTFTSSMSVLPAILSTDNRAFAITPEVDNARLRPGLTLTGNAATDRAAIANVAANWDVNDVTGFALPSALQGLPVDFTWVKASQKGSGVDVEWGVGTEEQIKDYTVEWSGDGRLFTVAGTVAASGKRSYTWSDIKPVAGNNFYRIRATEVSGATKYSTIAIVNLGKGKGIGVYPNVVRNSRFNLQITGMPAGNYKLNVHSGTGQLVYSRTINHTGGSATQTINLPSGLPKGIYRMNMFAAAENVVATIVIE
ncbi:MAG TPA: hypothetical protein VD993_06050 [Chitinophagaceae bacterium]|nr:hypothetical protein [Chitinophagaceae bacterium]